MRKVSGLSVAIAAMATMGTGQSAAALHNSNCVAGPFMVFFDADKDEITVKGAGVLDNATKAYQACGSQGVVVISGHTDRKGKADYNVGLSQRMAANVRSYLAGRGIPDGVMVTEAYGESRPLIDTKDGVRNAQNRRVEITFGPGSGW